MTLRIPAGAAVHGGPYKISAERAGKYTTIYKEGFMLKTHRSAPLVLAALLTSCASIPNGPSVMALPGSGRTFDQFREDDASCKLYASEQVEGRTPNDAAILSGVGTAALITALGAAAGAIFGGGSGAAIGAGGGLLVGGLMGTSSATASGNIGQQRYDIAYTQCMYGKGNHVPLSGQIMDGNRNPSSRNATPASIRPFNSAAPATVEHPYELTVPDAMKTRPGLARHAIPTVAIPGSGKAGLHVREGAKFMPYL